MPEPIITPEENVNQNNSGPNIDAELDAALSQNFAKKTEPVAEKIVEKEPEAKQIEKPSDAVKSEPKSNNKADPKKTDKPVENEKPILTPDEVEKMDPKKQDGWTAIKNSNKRAHSMIEQRDSEIKKFKETIAEKMAAHQKEVEDLRSKNSELEKYRAMIDIQADPEFISKFDKPVDDARSAIKEMIKSMNVSQETVDAIDFNDPKRLEEIVEIVSQNKDRFTAGKIERKMREYLDLADKRNETLDNQKKNFKETLEAKKKESFAKGAESEGRMLKHMEQEATRKDKDGNPMIPFLNRIEVKEGATQAEIDQANNHNGLVDLMTRKLQEVSKMNEPEHRAEINIAAVGAHYFKSLATTALARVKALEEELSKVSSVSSETPTRKPNNPTGRNGRNSDELMDIDQSLNAHFSGRGR